VSPARCGIIGLVRVGWTRTDDRLEFKIRLDPGEDTTGIGQGGRQVTLVTDRCTFKLPVDIEGTHPDVMALAAVCIVAPWLKSTIRFDEAISPGFAAALERGFGVDSGPIDGDVEARKTSHRAGLSYSGGADSMCVSELLRRDTPHIHLRRTRHPRVPNRATHYRADVAAALVVEAANRARSVHIVETDLEFLVGPFPMYPEWTTIGIGCVLLADRLDLGAAAFGTVMGSRYLSNGYRYQPVPAEDRWEAIFAAAGLPFLRPACGLTEVSTVAIAHASDLSDLVRSCALGGLDGPCLNCKKCVRKELTMAGIERRPLDEMLVRNVEANDAVLAEFAKPPPYYFQHVLEFGLARAVGIEDTFLGHAKVALRPTFATTDWATKFYPAALTHDVPEPLRAAMDSAIAARVVTMTPSEVEIVETWDAASRSHLGLG